MTLPQLYYIVAVDNHRHFNKAAEHCFITQPTLSMQIQKLEEELGVQIFDRSKQPVIPTDIGAKIIKQARIILQESERLHSIVSSETGEYAGTLKIGIIPTIAPYLIPLFLQTFVEKYPGIEIIINEVTTKEILIGINKDLLDVAVLALPINEHDMVERTLYYEPFIAYIPQNHPLYKKDKISLADISVDDMLLLKEGHCFRGQTLKICRTNEREWNLSNKKILFESGNLDTLKKLVEQNFGITLLPYLDAIKINEKDSKLIREFIPPVPKREIGIIHSKATSKNHLIEVLINEIMNSVPEELLEMEDSLIVK